MSLLIPLFPLQIVAFPGERIPLHIFEERYQQLIADTDAGNLSFGIATYINKVLSYGTEISLESIEARYENGACDIICQAHRVFKIEEFVDRMEDKLYAGGHISWLDNIQDSAPDLCTEMIGLIGELYAEINVPFDMEPDTQMSSFELAHKIGFSLDQEFELLTIIKESDRLRYIIDHLKKTIPVVREVNRTKGVIKMNGHFRNYDPLDFQEFKV